MIDPYRLMPSFLIALIWLIEDYFEDFVVHQYGGGGIGRRASNSRALRLL